MALEGALHADLDRLLIEALEVGKVVGRQVNRAPVRSGREVRGGRGAEVGGPRRRLAGAVHVDDPIWRSRRRHSSSVNLVAVPALLAPCGEIHGA